jgi:hypothetical protein
MLPEAAAVDCPVDDAGAALSGVTSWGNTKKTKTSNTAAVARPMKIARD